MGFGIYIYHDHVIAKSEILHPETKVPLYTISGLKDALEPPLITRQKDAMAYVRKVDPYKKEQRIDPYGYRRGTNIKVNRFGTKEKVASGEQPNVYAQTYET